MADNDAKQSSENDKNSSDTQSPFLIPVLELIPYKPKTTFDNTVGIKTNPELVTSSEFFAEIDEYLKSAGYESSIAKLSSYKSNNERNKDYGYIKGNSFPIRFKVTPDFEITDTITNDYSESFISEQINKFSNDKMRTLGNLSIKGISGGDLTAKLGEIGGDSAAWILDKLGAGGSGGGLGDLAKNISKTGAALFTGGRKDMAHVWNNTSFQQSYPFLTILKCDNPGNIDQYVNDIVKPLAILLNLVSPRSDDANKDKEGDAAKDLTSIYKWPYIVSAQMSGVFNIKIGAITGLDITKTTEYGLSENQRPKAVKVTFNIANLYHTLIGGSFGTVADTDQNTIARYLGPFGDAIKLFNGVDVAKTQEEEKQDHSAGEEAKPEPDTGDGLNKGEISDAKDAIEEKFIADQSEIPETGNIKKAEQDAIDERNANNENIFNSSFSFGNTTFNNAQQVIADTEETIATPGESYPGEDVDLTTYKNDIDASADALLISIGLLSEANTVRSSPIGSTAEKMKDQALIDAAAEVDARAIHTEKIIDKEPPGNISAALVTANAAAVTAAESKENVTTIDGWLGKEEAAEYEDQLVALRDLKTIDEVDAIASTIKETSAGNKILDLSQTVVTYDKTKAAIDVLINGEQKSNFIRSNDSNLKIYETNQTALAARDAMIAAAQLQFSDNFAIMNNIDKRNVLDYFIALDNAVIASNLLKIADLPLIPIPGSPEEALKIYYETDNITRTARVAANIALKNSIAISGTPTVPPTDAAYKRKINSIKYNIDVINKQIVLSESSGSDVDDSTNSIVSITSLKNAVVFPAPNDIVGPINGVPYTYTQVLALDGPYIP